MIRRPLRRFPFDGYVIMEESLPWKRASMAKTLLWDEYCHEVHEGPHEQLDWAWTATLDPVLQQTVASVPQHEALLLTIGVCGN